MIIIRHVFCDRKEVRSQYPDAYFIDVTSRSTDRFARLSPFFPHGEIPVPFSPGVTSMSVEGVWQGLKVFEKEGIDTSSFLNDTMKNLKRMNNYSRGAVIGHQKGVNDETLLGYVEARKLIYIPTYRWVLENKCKDLVDKIHLMSEFWTVVLLDFDLNTDIENTREALSHASLIRDYIESIK